MGNSQQASSQHSYSVAGAYESTAGGNTKQRSKSQLKKQRIDSSSRLKSFSFCQDKVRQNSNTEWLSYFKQEAKEVKEQCGWVNPVLKSLRKYQGYPVDHFQAEFSSTRISRQENNKNGMKETKSMSTLSKQQQQSYRKLLKQSDIIEDDMAVIKCRSFLQSGSMLGQFQRSNLGRPSKHVSNNHYITATFENVNQTITHHQQHNYSYNAQTINPVGSRSFSQSFASIASHEVPSFSLQQKVEVEHSAESIDALDVYVKKIAILTHHLSNNNHVLSFLISRFLDYYIPMFSRNNQAMTEENASEICATAVGELQQFISITSETIWIMYDIETVGQSLTSTGTANPHFHRENIFNFFTSFLFKNTQLYSLLLHLHRQADKSLENNLNDAFLKISDKQAQDFYMHQRICLNETTLHYYNSKKPANSKKGVGIAYGNNQTKTLCSPILETNSFVESMNSSNQVTPRNSNNNNNENGTINNQEEHHLNLSKDSMIISKTGGGAEGNEISISISEPVRISVKAQEIEQELSEMPQEDAAILSKEESQKKEKLKAKKQQNMTVNDSDPLDLKQEAYFKAMKYINRITWQQTPINKMKMIIKASENMIQCISNYYEEHNIEEIVELDGMDVLSLFSFFIAKTKFTDINAHIKLTNSFLTNNLLASQSGHCLATLSGSILNVISIAEARNVLSSEGL